MFGLKYRQIFILLVFIALVFAGAQYALAYFQALEFNDFIRQEVKFAMSARRSPEEVRTSVVDKAKELSIPIQARDVRITRRGPSFTLDLEYRLPVDLRFYQHELVFHTNESGESFEK